MFCKHTAVYVTGNVDGRGSTEQHGGDFHLGGEEGGLCRKAHPVSQQC